MNDELLKRICNTPGVPGYEDEIQQVVTGALAASCDEVRRDRLGNVIGLAQQGIEGRILGYVTRSDERRTGSVGSVAGRRNDTVVTADHVCGDR